MKPMINVYMRDLSLRWVEAGLFPNGETFADPNAQVIGIHNKAGELIAGMVYHNYCEASQSIEMSCHSTTRNWANKRTLDLLFRYPFVQIGCRIVVARHSEHHDRARRIWKALGAQEYIIPELRAEGEAEVIAVLRRETWNHSKFKRR